MSSAIKGVTKGLFGTEKGTIQTQANSSPWSGVQPYLLDLFQRGQSALNSAPSQSSQYTNQAGQSLGGLLNPNPLPLDPSSNPQFTGAINNALGLAKSQFAGQYGGAAGQNINNSGYQESLARGLGQAATSAYADQFNRNLDYNRGLMGLQLGAIGAAPGLDQATNLYSSPFTNLEQYKSLLSAGLPFSQSTNQQPYYQNNTAQTLGIAATAAPFILSDVRTKENIERIGTHDSGAGIYKYQYKGNPAPQIGVLAQEMEQVKPEAVEEVGGVKFVNFRMI